MATSTATTVSSSDMARATTLADMVPLTLVALATERASALVERALASDMARVSASRPATVALPLVLSDMADTATLMVPTDLVTEPNSAQHTVSLTTDQLATVLPA